SKEKIAKKELSLYLSDMISHVSYKFLKALKDVFHYKCTENNCETCDCDERAQSALRHLLQALPEIRKMLIKDIKAAYAGDPAATSLEEIVLSYPYIEAIASHRIAHILYQEKVPIIPRIMSERSHSLTGIDIHPGAEIGEGFFIDHGTGVVIGETCRIGKNVKLYQGVTLGALSPFDKEGKPKKGQKRHPTIEDDVIIYANATILGGSTVIGKGAIIGGNTWIVKSIPPGAKVYKD
ncbi:MAG: serine O-acetyltransferase EpsC, partial [Spirochaetota bacterium]